MVDNKLKMSQQCALVVQKASSLLECVNRSLGSRSRKVIISFYFSTFEVISHKEYIDKLEQVQKRAINMIRVYKED